MSKVAFYFNYILIVLFIIIVFYKYILNLSISVFLLFSLGLLHFNEYLNLVLRV